MTLSFLPQTDAECPAPAVPEHALMAPKYNGAILLYFCEPGYTLIGSHEIYCDGRHWNGTVPYCRGIDTFSSSLLFKLFKIWRVTSDYIQDTEHLFKVTEFWSDFFLLHSWLLRISDSSFMNMNIFPQVWAQVRRWYDYKFSELHGIIIGLIPQCRLHRP